MDLESLRQKIDTIDQEILRSLNERIRLVVQIGKIKGQKADGFYVPSREEEIFQKLLSINQGPLDEMAIRSIYREIISASIALQKKILVAYLGPAATYTHQAAMKNFGSSLDYRSFASITDIFTAVEKGEADYGVIPIENSTEGAVFHSLDMFAESELKIIAQIYLNIEHCLLSQSPLEELEIVLSKDQALGQCRDWLQRNLPRAQLKEVSSTAEAVKQAKTLPHAAAVASELAGDIYGVPIVKKGIQDKGNNVTRFLVIGQPPLTPSVSGNDKTSLLISINDEAGALQRALEPFSTRGINLTKIESRPSRRKAWDYYFFVDFIGHYEDTQVQEAIENLKRVCPQMKWLGSYPNVQY